MLTHVVKRFLKFFSLLVAAGLFALFFSRIITTLYAYPRLFSTRDVPPAPIAIVYGAGLWRDGSPTPVLRDRVATAVELYNEGKVEKILMSGYRRSELYNEPASMKKYAVSLGVPETAIVLDLAGHRTYDTCYRAREIFNIEKAILVTQQFHLPRALYTCRVLGVAAVGVSADRRDYRTFSLIVWNLREFFATLTAFWDLHINRPLPVLGLPEPIFGTHSQ